LGKYRRGHHSKHLIKKVVNTYFDTRGSYRRTAKNIDRKIKYSRIWRIVDTLGHNCKSFVQVAEELHPVWSGFLGLDGKTVRVGGKKLVLLIAVDLSTEDIVDAMLADHEDYFTIRPFLKEIRDEIGYKPNEAVIDLDQAWEEAVSDIFPDVPIQLCVVHFERIFDREVPASKRTAAQQELKEIIRRVIYSKNMGDSKNALNEILLKRKQRRFRDRKSLKMIRSLEYNFEMLATHFRVPNSFRDNNRTESVNDKIQTRLGIIRGYKKRESAWNSLKLVMMHYRFNLFESCKDSTRNGKCPLNFAGVDTSKLDWIEYSQRDRSVLREL
jgi:transposase-like protein